MPGYLAPDTLPHLYTNLADCLSDSGTLTDHEALQAQRLHERCSPHCRVRQRLDAEPLPAAGGEEDGSR